MDNKNTINLSCKDLACIRGDFPVFSGFNLNADAGDLIVLTGANGSGKSSLLRLLAGLMRPSEGAIHWQGENIAASVDYYQHSLFISHQNAMKPQLSIYDNILYYARLKGTDILVSAALQFFDLLPIADIPVSQLSAGWQRRVALARLLSEPSLLWLLDEPFANLDAQGKALLEGLIQTRLSQGGIVILSSHEKLENPQARYIAMEDFQLKDAAHA